MEEDRRGLMLGVDRVLALEALYPVPVRSVNSLGVVYFISHVQVP